MNKTKQDNVPQVKTVECDTPKCKCGGRTALVSGSWYFSPDQEPYLNGVVQESKVSDGNEHIIGYVCDDCGSLTDLFSDDREGYSSRIAELEAENTKMREALEGILKIEFGYEGEGIPEMTSLVDQALKGKEVKDG